MSKKRKKLGTIAKAKEESLKDHQGVTEFTGSAYNGKGGVDHGKKTSNRKRR